MRCRLPRSTLSALPLLAALAVSVDAIAQEIRAGVLPDWPPYYLVDSSGAPTGFAVETMDAVAARAGLTVSYRTYSNFLEMARGLERGEIDVIPNYGIIESRETLFTETIGTFRVSLFTRASNTNIPGAGDLAGATIGVVRSNVGEELVAEIDGAIVRTFDNLEETIFRLLAGDLDAIIYPAPVVWGVTEAARLDHLLREIEPPLREVSRAIAVAPRQEALWVRLDAAVTEFVGTPEYVAIYERWHRQPEPWLTVRTVAYAAGAAVLLLAIGFVGWRYRTIRHFNRELSFRASLLDVVEEAVVAVDASGRITYWNRYAEELYGWTREEVIGRPVLEVTVTDQAEKEAQHVLDVVRAGHSWTGEFTVKRKDGTTFPAFVKNAPIYDDQGKVAGIVGTSSDLTQHRQLEQQLRQAQKMEAIGRLTGGIAHDFNNILSVIKGNAELALDEIGVEAPAFGYLSELEHTVDHAADLVRQLLSFSKVNPIRTEVVNVSSVITNFKSMLRRTLREDIALEIHCDADLWPIEIDRTQLEQVLMNLVINAGEAMPEGGKLEISTRNLPSDAGADGEAECIEISVSDTGIGIPGEARDLVFEPFFTSKQAKGGTGLGLATVHSVITRAGGSVLLESEPGRGTTFRLRLPRTTREPIQDGEYTAVTKHSASDALIMVVEDDDSVRSLVCRMLADQGYRYIESGDPELALKDDRLGFVDLVISDVVMPVLKGPEMVERMRRQFPDLPVLFMTGYAQDEFIPQDETQHVLRKPFDRSSLLAAVQDLLHRSGHSGDAGSSAGYGSS